jgi:hypothetical protein
MSSAALRQEDLLVDELAGLARAHAESQDFVSLLAHELRTRLKVTERALSSADEDGLDTALENTRTLQDLVETLLELARGQVGECADAGAAVRRVLEDIGDDVELLEAEIVAGELPFVPCPRDCSTPSSATSSQTRSKRAPRRSRCWRVRTARSASATTGPAFRSVLPAGYSGSTRASSAAQVSG